MSSGHHHHPLPHATEGELARVRADPEVSKNLARKITINRKFDIPYLGGYSRSGHIIYLDRHLPLRIKVGARSMSVLRPLIAHETMEKALMDALGWGYLRAHNMASLWEDREVRRQGFLPGHYNAALKPYIKADEHEKLVKVPLDLDMRPYRSEPIDVQLLRRIEECQEHEHAH